MTSGPLVGVKVVEFAGIGPGPFCAMLLADMGADVVRIDRKGAVPFMGHDLLLGKRRTIAADLKSAAEVASILQLLERADVLLEGFRPGVMERLGLGPDVVCERNPRLVYGRMTGWGQQGPLAHAAGHDLNYIAITGALHASGKRDDVPRPPLNLLGDFGGGALYLAMGICAALFERGTSGRGQVIDCAITDGVASLMTMIYGMRASGAWTAQREDNVLDGGTPCYRTYACKDGFVSIGALEPHFYAELLQRLELADDPEMKDQHDKSRWPRQRQRFAEVFARRTQEEWRTLLEGTDACFAAVPSIDEAPKHPHNVARGTFVEIDGVMQPAPAPRFSRTPAAKQRGATPPPVSVSDVLARWR